MVCDCLVELAHVFIDKTFTYKLTEEQVLKLKIGMRVEVPFNNQVLEGFVLAIREDCGDGFKSIIRIVDDYPILNDELLALGYHIKDDVLCSLMSSYQAMLPLALKAKKKINMNPKMEKYIKLNDSIILSDYKFNEKQGFIIDLVLKDKFVLKSYLNSISPSSVKTLIKNNVLIEESKEIYRLNIGDGNSKSYSLNDSQLDVLNSIELNVFMTYLLYGVTGSGKTNVYMELIDRVISSGKTAIVLVPEISLTPQIINRFCSKFKNIALLHSGLSDGEKFDEWRKIREQKVDIVIGARSAVFAPLENIGVIIVDEEHSVTYKQDNTPRYNAIDVAKYRASYHNCPLILGSATPSLESYARAEKGVYKLLELKERFNKKDLPIVKIIDMNNEFKKANGYFSNDLISEIQDKINKNEQVILFLNRRGYSSMVTCSSCGNTEKCPNCDITLTYHKSSNMLRCHYCGYAKKKEEFCSCCGALYKEFGLGTEKVQEELDKLVDNARILRMDIDTTSKKDAHKKIIESFSNGEYNILIGTQMIAKGLDFPNVTLVGVINADISLNFPDFRSSEYTFQLLNQVGGRSGRGALDGEVLIQTFNPLHYAITYTKDNDYIGFYKEEMKIRRKLGYPPYYYLCLIRIISSDYNDASECSIKIGKYLKDNISLGIVLGPSLCNMFRINNKYHFQVIIKYKKKEHVLEQLKFINEHYFNNRKVKVEIDFNPVKL